MSKKVIIELTEDEARMLRGCIIRTHASGEMLDVGEKVEEIIDKQLNQNDNE